MATRSLTRTLLAAGALALPAVAAAPASGATPTAKAVAYLARIQDGHGCVGASTGSGWAAVGFAVGGNRPRAQRAARCSAKGWRSFDQITDAELAVLALVAAHLNPQYDSAAKLVTRIQKAVRANGTIGGTTNGTIFGVLALRAAGRRVPAKVVTALVKAQRANGAYGWAPGVSPDSNMTAAAIQALRVAGYPATSKPVKHALNALLTWHRADGGYALASGQSDTQSTAWAIQALAVTGRSTRSARAYIVKRQRANGSIAYRSGDYRTPGWVTSQGLTGLTARPFPVH